MGAARRPGLHLPASHRAARRGPRRRHVLSPLLALAAPAGRRARLRRHRLSDQGGRAPLRRAGARARAGGRRLLETQPVPGSLRAGPGRPDPECGRVADRGRARPGGRRRHRGGAGLPIVGRREGGDLESLRRSVPQSGSPSLRLLQRVGRVDPESLDAYLASGGYAALDRAIELGPAGVIREVLASKLMGRGGAAFPTGRKWDAVAKAADRPHYVVCNADESEPGTFKDRVLMEGDPFAVLEGMTIAGFATGSERGYLYIRGEYPLAARPDGRGDRRGPGRRMARRTTSGTRASRSTSSSVAARRLYLRRGDGPVQLDRRASAASRATSRPSRCNPGCSASRRSSTTSRRW